MEICPLCKNTREEAQWINCDACKTWLHTACLNLTLVDDIKKFYCPSCTKTHGPTTYKDKTQQRKSNRDHTKLNYADLNEGNSAGDERIWGKLLNVKQFKEDKFKRYKASEVNIELLRSNGFREPFVIETNEPELEMKMPSSDITVKDITRLVGGDDYPVEVIDVASQSEIPGWTMGRWAEYFESPERDRIRNVISLEISGSELASQITRPRIVREMDWIDLMWPTKSHPDEFPRVQLYCLMGTKDSYTDFHVDFGGSSVFYHILSGSKTFYFIEPTLQNLKKYQKWTSSPDQSTTFLGDEVKECYSIKLKPGNTMLIPAGWIHAVYTPEDAIVIGGNFLQTFNVGAQIQVYAIEDATQVPLKFRFPFYQRLNWYALFNFEKWLSDPENNTKYSYYELESMAVLSAHLKNLLKKNEKIANGSPVSHNIRKQYDIPESITDPLALTRRVMKLVKETLSKQTPIKETEQSPQTIKIRMTTAGKKRERDDVYIDEEFDEDDDFEEDIITDDDEYMSENDEDHEDMIENKKRGRTTKKKRTKIQNDSSSEDDSMGTSSTSKLSSALLSRRKRLLSNNAPQKSAKQRLMDRIIGNKRH